MLCPNVMEFIPLDLVGYDLHLFDYILVSTFGPRLIKQKKIENIKPQQHERIFARDGDAFFFFF